MKELTTTIGSTVVMPHDIRDLTADQEPATQPRQDRLEYMAALLEQLPEDGRFNLREWETCICAWTHHAAGQTHRPLARLNPIHLARQWLGIPLKEATQLFHPELDVYGDVTAKQAARVIRHYADTGEVNWSVAALVPAREKDLIPA
jgi:hypothetical protein